MQSIYVASRLFAAENIQKFVGRVFSLVRPRSCST